MVGLVLKHPSPYAACFNLDLVALAVQALDDHLGSPFNFTGHARNAQTTLGRDLLTFPGCDFRVDDLP